MGFFDDIRKIKQKAKDVKREVDRFNDIKEDPNGKIIEQFRGNLGLDNISFGDSGPNIFHNPSFIKEQNQYNQKAESFASFIKPGIPHLVFEVETEKSVTTKASKNAQSALNVLEKISKQNIEISQFSLFKAI